MYLSKNKTVNIIIYIHFFHLHTKTFVTCSKNRIIASFSTTRCPAPSSLSPNLRLTMDAPARRPPHIPRPGGRLPFLTLAGGETAGASALPLPLRRRPIHVADMH